jgi:hypothetical protein
MLVISMTIPRAAHSIILDFNMTLLYGCNLATGNPMNLYSYKCSDSKSIVYTVTYPAVYSGICTPSFTVTIPIFGTQVAQLVSGNGNAIY